MAEEKTNWISWTLQGLLGLICGLYEGFALSHTRDGPWMQPGCTGLFVWGATLLGMGIATIYGTSCGCNFRTRPIRPKKSPAGGSEDSCRRPCAWLARHWSSWP